MIGGGIATVITWPKPTDANTTANLQYPADIATSFNELNRRMGALQDRQAKTGRSVVSADTLRTSLSRIQLEAAVRQYITAREQITQLTTKIAGWDAQLTREIAMATTTPPPAAMPFGNSGLFVPILVYHYTPGNFAQQLEYLRTHNYTAVDLDQVAAAMSGGTALPAKPVVITFDDGFANQMNAFSLLQHYHMKATYYIINGGEGSRWCIGSGRRYNDPLQPVGGCGDAYLNWDQVRMLDKSGLITIGAHTVDHENLASDSSDRQRYEIIQGKADLEQEIGHEVRHFCYPYGSYNQTTIDIVRQAGFITATTTLPGTIQPPGSLYTLRRIRDTLSLP